MMRGRELCRQFFHNIAGPILENQFPGLEYSAGLLGYGSDVLGYDDEVSTDHMWGPRFYLFLREKDMGLQGAVMDAFARGFPCQYQGYSVNFSEPDPNDNGVRHPEWITEGPVSPLVFLHTPEEFFQSYLGISSFDSLSERDWLSFSEHRLLSLTKGELYQDRLNLQAELSKLSFYPDPVWRYLIASNWSLIAEEQAFVRRCSDVGDEIGSALICGRMAERLMRLAFLYCKQYAPYSKWFGTAFQKLPVEDDFKAAVRRAVLAQDSTERESNIVEAQVLAAQMQNRLGITEPVDIQVQNYYNRKIKVIFAERLADAVMETVTSRELKQCPLIGTLSQIGNFSAISDEPEHRNRVMGLY